MKIRSGLNNVFLVTGGTGSFGSSFVKYLLNRKVKEVRVFDRDEEKQEDMRQYYNDPRLKVYMGDVRDESSVDYAMKGVDYVFHAAALKQVPACEFHPLEAVKTNIIGSDNVISSAIKNKVKKVTLLSTDKAVYPINAMGMTKALMEKIMLARARNQNKGTVLCGTRYGNVMGSRGSVIPLFIKQIKEGKPITVTNPNMTRFLMSLDESIDLVMHSCKHGENGDIFIRKAPASTILDLAYALRVMFNASNPIKIIGVRHGEKLYETLISEEEMSRTKDLGGYYKISPDTRDLNYNIFIDKGYIPTKGDGYTSHNTERLKVGQIRELLLTLDCVKEAL